MAEEIIYNLSQRPRETYPEYVQQFMPRLDTDGTLLFFDHEHAMHGALLYDLVCYFHAQTVVEIGTRNGKSTRIIVEALRRTQGHLYTIDNFPSSCKEVSLEDMANFVTKVPFKDTDVEWTMPINVLFVDHSHTYVDTRRTLRKFWPFITTPGAMLIADNDSHFEQGRAVRDFAESLHLGYVEDSRAQGHALFLKPSFPKQYRDKGPSRHLFALEEKDNWNHGPIEVTGWVEQPFA